MSPMLKRLVLCLAIFCLTSLSEPADGAKHKNVLLICIDDLRPVLGCYGGASKTPNVDRLAKNATVFTKHYNQCPVCVPFRASILSGLRPDSTGIHEIGDSWRISKCPTRLRPCLPPVLSWCFARFPFEHIA